MVVRARTQPRALTLHQETCRDAAKRLLLDFKGKSRDRFDIVGSRARESDAFGQNCPYAAHTRRTNPRDDTFVLGDTASDGSHPYAEMHRIRRFATPYGPPYVPNSDVNDEPRGLVGLFMGANLSLQFEFIMQTWISSLPGQFRFPDQSPNTSGIDPLFGPQDDDSQSGDFEFDYCISPPSTYTTVPDLSRFIVTKGGLYVFLPSVTALGLMAKGEIVPTGC